MSRPIPRNSSASSAPAWAAGTAAAKLLERTLRARRRRPCRRVRPRRAEARDRRHRSDRAALGRRPGSAAVAPDPPREGRPGTRLQPGRQTRRDGERRRCRPLLGCRDRCARRQSHPVRVTASQCASAPTVEDRHGESAGIPCLWETVSGRPIGRTAVPDVQGPRHRVPSRWQTARRRGATDGQVRFWETATGTCSIRRSGTPPRSSLALQPRRPQAHERLRAMAGPDSGSRTLERAWPRFRIGPSSAASTSTRSADRSRRRVRTGPPGSGTPARARRSASRSRIAGESIAWHSTPMEQRSRPGARTGPHGSGMPAPACRSARHSSIAERVHALAFSPDGRRLATACADGTARCWRIPAPVAGDVERITCWVRVATELEFDEGDAIRRLDQLAVWELRRRLQDLGGSPVK